MSKGTRHKCSVAILMPKQYKYNIDEVVLGDNGRFILLQGTFNDNKLSFLNYYTPTNNKTGEQKQELPKILPHIHDNFTDILWGGDMNMTLQPKLDKNGMTERTAKYVTKVSEIVNKFDLCDIWHLLHPNTKRYTWRRATPKGIQQSRLDYFIIL